MCFLVLRSSGAADDDDVPELEAVEEEGPVDETGIDPKDIDLVIQQVNCSRAKAVRVLKESGGDLINASAYCSSLQISRSCLTSVCSHGSERVMLCCTVSLPHCFTLCHPFAKIYPMGLLLHIFAYRTQHTATLESS